MSLRLTRRTSMFLRIVRYMQIGRLPHFAKQFSTAIDAFTYDLVHKQRNCVKSAQFDPIIKMKLYIDSDNKDIVNSTEDLDTTLHNLLSKNKDKQIENVVADCLEKKIFINNPTLKKLFRYYSKAGRPDIVSILQNYCAKVDPNCYKRNGEFMHYLAKAQCMKGNSEKGLVLLQQCYQKYDNLRTLYRLILKELINDTVFNRSEASLVVFKRHVLELSSRWEEHYPLLCLWHLCWTSNWFSDQMLANELLDSSTALQEIIRDKATAFSITVLRNEYNDDAVLRLLQSLIKYEMMAEYTKVLQILFSYKISNHDVRGCAEIMKNCEALGISLSGYQQGRYIQMLIANNQQEKVKKKADSKPFQLKF